jgi:hypothetical protein
MTPVRTEEQLLQEAFARLDAVALGIAVGVLCGVVWSAATTWLLVKGGPHVGQNLSLLSQFFFGYRVTWRGAVIALGYGCLAGFLAGWAFAKVRNAAVGLYLQVARAKAVSAAVRNFFDNV